MAGAVFAILGFILLLIDFVVLPTFSGVTGSPRPELLPIILRSTASLVFSAGTSLFWAGVVLYALGRLLDRSSITILGFERTEPSECTVRGPDENNTVWIGRSYKHPMDAEHAVLALKERLGDDARIVKG